MKSNLHIDSYGTMKWYKNGKLHRDNGPAEIWPNGAQFWYKNGLRHREDGPAELWSEGDMWCYLNGNKVKLSVSKHYERIEYYV